MNDTASISRQTSISRASRQGSTVSRSQSLIKKNIAPHDLRPSDVLIERFVAWKVIVKQLIAYFEGIADIENNTAKEMTKLGAVIQVPFRSGNQFLGEGGLQDVYYSIRDKTRIIADQHANLGRTIDSSIVQHLQKLRVEIKAHIKNVQNDTGKLATSVAKERELSTRLISELSTNISVFKNTPMQVTSKTDPYVANQAVMRQLQKQIHEENALQKSIIIMQQNSAHFESGIVRALQSAWATFDEWQSRLSASVQATWSAMGTQFAELGPDEEWVAFAARSDHLLDPETPLRSADVRGEEVRWPSKEDPSVLPVHEGWMERKKRYTRAYKESFYVLTPAGFLHEYAGSDPKAGNGLPIFSLFLPMCTLGPASSIGAKSHKFHIEGRKDGSGTLKTGSIRSLTGRVSGSGGSGGGHAWSFRARSHEDMMEWWNDIRMLCARYLVASEHMERSGPVHAAVRAAGYASEDEGEGSEDEGSSVEEEEEEEEDEAGRITGVHGQRMPGGTHDIDGEGTDEEVTGERYEEAREGAVTDGEDLPSYSHPTRDSGIEIGANGYALDKKHTPGSNGVGRKPSLRQQEKAPEGRPAHVDADGSGPSGVDGLGPTTSGGSVGQAPIERSESRFTEGL